MEKTSSQLMPAVAFISTASVATELIEALVRAEEGLLREVHRHVVFPSHAIRQSVDAVHVLFVEDSKRRLVAVPRPLHQFHVTQEKSPLIAVSLDNSPPMGQQKREKRESSSPREGEK